MGNAVQGIEDAGRIGADGIKRGVPQIKQPHFSENNVQAQPQNNVYAEEKGDIQQVLVAHADQGKEAKPGNDQPGHPAG